MTYRAAHAERSSGRRARWAVPVAAVTFLSLFVIGSSTATRPDEGPLERASLSQAGRSLILQIKTDRQIALRKLNRQPDFRSGRAHYLCLEAERAGRGVVSRICLGGKRSSHHRVGVSRTSASGKVFSRDTIAARVKRVGGTKLVVAFDPGAARLPADTYEWRVAAADGRCEGAGDGCATFFPRGRRHLYRLLPVRAVGCTGGDGEVVRHGPRGRPRVALTFDDGPGPYTDDVLSVLRRKKAKATFFMLGQQVSSYPETARKVLAAGHELANHSSRHALLPSADDVARASRVIRHRTGFKPCLFRPPYGAINSTLKQGVARAGMKSVLWDVDTLDWRLPGSGSIGNAIKNARAGSIVLMHDAGGPRGQTVEALPGAIRSLRKRGFELVTVTELLGERFRYRPVE